MTQLVTVALLSAAMLGHLVLRLHGVAERLDAVAPVRGESAPSARRAPPVAGSAQPSPGHPPSETAALLEEVRKLRQELRAAGERNPQGQARAQRGQPAALPMPGEQRVLSVLRDERGRRRERHLRFLQDRWTESRGQSLDEFTDIHGLTSDQRDELESILMEELDGIFGVMRDRRLREHPERAMEDLLELVERTDRRGAAVLNPAQRQAWSVARLFERTVLMPWLPKR